MVKIAAPDFVPSNAFFSDAELIENGSCDDVNAGQVVQSKGGVAGSEIVFENVSPGKYAVVSRASTIDNKLIGSRCQEVSVAPPPPRPERCEVKNWFTDPEAPRPSPKLSYSFAEAASWFMPTDKLLPR